MVQDLKDTERSVLRNKVQSKNLLIYASCCRVQNAVFCKATTVDLRKAAWPAWHCGLEQTRETSAAKAM